MVSHFEYEIMTLMAHPTSDYQYIARIKYIVCISGEASEIVPWPEHQIPETWGANEAEAYYKLEDAIQEWITAQAHKCLPR